jgi:hypothetical protein
MRDPMLPGPRPRGTDSRDVRSRKRRTVGGEAGQGADPEEGEKEEAFVPCAVISWHTSCF